MSHRYLPSALRATQPWRNGGGLTREITASPGLWRLSIAQIDADGPFSPFPEYRRTLIPLSGAGIELDIDGTIHRVAEPFEPFTFAGAAQTSCHLLDGPVTVLNVMLAGNGTADVIRPQGTVALGLSGLVALICLQGRISVLGYALSPHDAILVQDEPGARLECAETTTLARARPAAFEALPDGREVYPIPDRRFE